MGKILSNGQVRDLRGTVLGRVFSDGKIKSRDGTTLGIANHNGVFSGQVDSSAYKMDSSGNIFHRGRHVGGLKQLEAGIPILFVQWAACLLLLKLDDSDPSILETIVSSPEQLQAMVRLAKIDAIKKGRCFDVSELLT